MYSTNTFKYELTIYLKKLTSENPCDATNTGNVLYEVPFYYKISIFDIINSIVLCILISQNCVTFSI